MAYKAKVPDGYDSVEDFLKEARDRWQEGVDFDRENREAAHEDLKFFAGEQWEPQDVKARAGKPCLTINQLPQFVAQVVGDIRINKPAIKARPAQDADEDLADIREGLIRAIEHDSKAPQIYASAGQSQTACGIGNFGVRLDYASDSAFDRDIVIRDIPDPFAVVWDPARIEPTGKDAGWCFVRDEVPRKAFEKRYPDVTASELGQDFVTHLAASGWMTHDVVRITEYWVMKERPAQIALLQGGQVVEITDQNRAEITPQVQKNAKGQPMVRKTTRKSACMYLITGHDILEEPVEYPIDRLPVFRVPGWEVNTGSKVIRWGLVRFARDAQRLKNYWRSVSAEKLALAPRQQWLIHESQTGDQSDFRDAATNGDTVLTWNGAIEPKRLEPPPIEAALLQEASLNAQDMKDVTGLHDASLGARSNETSGKAILARERQGDTATFIYSDNLHNAIQACGDVIDQLIPSVMDTARTVRVLGEDSEQKLQRINDPLDPNSVDLGKAKFDIYIDVGPSYATKRVEAAESMMQFVQAVPQAAQVAGDLIAKAQDWPLADQIGDRLKKTLPPQITAGEDEHLSDEEKQQRLAQAQQAQQQQQLAESAAELELNEKAAKVEKLHAEANKIKAETEGVGQGEPGPDPGLQAAALRKAEAEAALAEANAGIAYFNLSQLTANPRLAEAEASKAEADALSAHVGVVSDIIDLHAKPAQVALDQAHGRVDLQTKLNPPEAEASGASPPKKPGGSTVAAAPKKPAT